MALFLNKNRKKDEEETKPVSFFNNKQTKQTGSGRISGASGSDRIVSSGTKKSTGVSRSLIGRDTLPVASIAKEFLSQSNAALVRGDLDQDTWMKGYNKISRQLKENTTERNKAQHQALQNLMDMQGKTLFRTQKSPMTAGADSISNTTPRTRPVSGPPSGKASKGANLQGTALYMANGGAMNNMTDREVEYYRDFFAQRGAEYKDLQRDFEAQNQPKSVEDLNSKLAELENGMINEITAQKGYVDDSDWIRINQAKEEYRQNYNESPQQTMPDKWKYSGVYNVASAMAENELNQREIQRKYIGNTQNSDWDERSQYQQRKVNIDVYGLESQDPKSRAQMMASTTGNQQYLDDYYDVYYEAINGSKDAMFYLRNVKSPTTGEVSPGADAFVEEYMTDDERKMFNYLWSESRDAALEYVSDIREELNKRAYIAGDEELRERLRNADPASLVLANLGSIPLDLAEGMGNLIGAGIDLIRDGKIDPYSMRNVASTISDVTDTRIREAVAEAGGSTFLQTLASMGYQAPMAGMKSALSLSIGGALSDALGLAGGAYNAVTEYASLGLQSMGAAANTLQNELIAGVPQDRAIADAATAYIVEAATEKIGMDNLFNSAWRGKGAWITWAKQMLAEGSEELVGDIASDALGELYDRLTNTSYSELNRRANAMIIQNGLDPADREKVLEQLMYDRIQEYAVDFGVGALSTVGGEGTAAALSSYAYASGIASHVPVSRAQDVVDYVQSKVDMDSPAQKKAVEVQQKIADNTIKDSDVSALVRKAVYETMAIEDNEERQQTEDEMFRAFGLAQFLTPSVSVQKDPTETETADTVVERTIAFAQQQQEDDRFVRDTIDKVIAAGADPTEAKSVIEAYVGYDSSVPIFDLPGITDADVQELTDIGDRQTLVERIDPTAGGPIEKRITKETLRRLAADTTTVNTAAVNPVEPAPQPVQTPVRNMEAEKAFAQTLPASAQNVYRQAMQEAQARNVPTDVATRGFMEVYNASANQTTYQPTEAVRSLSGGMRAAISQAAYAESIAETNRLEQRGFAKMDSNEPGVIANPIVTKAIADGRLSQRTADLIHRFEKMLGTRVDIVETAAENGKYESHNAKITIALDSWFLGKSAPEDAAVLGTFGHELTHRLQDISPQIYNQFASMVSQMMGSGDFAREVNRQMNLARKAGVQMSPIDAQAEVIANFVGHAMFGDIETAEKLLNGIKANTVEEKTKLQGLRDLIRKVIAWIRGNKDAFSQPEKTISNLERLEQSLSNLIGESAEAVETYGTEVPLMPAGEHPNIPQTPAEEVQYSLRNKDEIFDRVAEYNLEAGNIDEKVLNVAKKIMDDTAKLLSDPRVAELIPEENLLAGVDRDAKGKKLSTLYGNESYGYTGESSTICPRSLAMENLLDLVSRELGHSLTVKEGIAVSQLAWAYTQNPTCQYCYVWADRLQQREAREAYLQMRDNVLKSVGTVDGKIVTQAALTTPTTVNGKRTNTVFVVEDAVAKHPELKKQLLAYDKFLAGRKNTKNQKKRFIQWMDLLKNGSAFITHEQAATEGTMAQAVLDNPSLQEQAKDLYDYSLKASHAKLKVGYVAYNNDILKLSDKVINKMNDNYGIRFYSYSDYHPAFILENMQMIADASARGLKGLAYTKDLDFVRIFADTGCGINISIKAIDGTTEMDGMQGADWTEARELRDKYDNVGIIMVATSDEQVEWAISQDWIDCVIPYHVVFSDKVGKIFGWTNYRAMQSDKKLKGWDSSKDIKDIAPPMHQNNKQLYLDLCEKNHLEPRFIKWLDNPNYMKLVNETRQPEGLTKPLQPVFNMDAVRDSINKLIKDGGYDNPYASRNQETIRELAEEFSEIVRGADDEKLEKIARGEVRFSIRDSEYMDAVNRGDMATAQRMVDEAAKEAGYNYRGYHGTDKSFTTFKPGRATGWGEGIYVASNIEDAENYGKNTMSVYLKMENPYTGKTLKAENTQAFKKYVNDYYKEIARRESMTVEEVMEDMPRPSVMDMVNDENVNYLNAAIRELGYDGIMMEGSNDIIGTEMVVFDPNQVKSADPVTYDDAGNVIPLSERFIAENPDIRYSIRDSYGFYSQLEDVIENYKGEKIGASSIESYLKGRGVKDEEIKWSGIRTYLEGKKSVTKSELLSYIRDNQIEITEDTLESYDSDVVYENESGVEYTREQIEEDADNYQEEWEFARYDIDETPERLRVSFYDDDDNIEEEYIYLTRAIPNTNPGSTRWQQYTLNGGYNYREILFRIPGSDYSNNAMRTHWGRRSGVLAHARVQDFTDADGNKILFVEEIQSDWHNTGKKEGYLSEYHAEYDYSDRRWLLYDKNGNVVERYDQLATENDRAKVEEAFRNRLRNKVAPDAPFRNNYTDFVLKSLLRMAVEGNYDYLAWTPAEIQSERWSDQYAEGYRIEYDQDIPKFLKKYGKQWGASISDIEMTGGYIVPSINVTDSMREGIQSKGQPRFSLREENPVNDYTAIIERHEQNERMSIVMEPTSQWRKTITALDTKKLRAGTDAILNRFGDTLTPTQRNRINDKVRKLANDIIQNPKMPYGDISDRAVDIASDIGFQSAGVQDAAGRAAMEGSREAADAVDYLTNLVLANIVTTQSKETSKAAREVQRQIERNEKLKETLADVRAKRDAKIREDIEHRKEMRQKRAESKERKYLLEVMNQLNKLAKKSPADQRKKIMDIIGEFNLTCQRLTDGKVQKLEELKRWVNQRMQEDPQGFNPNPNVLKAIEELNQSYIENLTIAEVRNITRALLNIENEIREGKHLLGVEDRREVNALGREVIEGIKDSRRSAIRHTKGIDGLYNEMARPETFFLRLIGFVKSNPLYRLTFGSEQSLDTGFRAMIDYKRRANERYFRKYLDDKSFQRSIIGKNARAIEIRGRDENGDIVTLKVTPDLLMAIYMHGRNDQNLKHFVDQENRRQVHGEWVTEEQKAGGMTIPDFELYRKGKVEEAYRKGTKITMSRAEVRHIASLLTAEEMGYIHAAQRYYKDMSQPEINEVSEELNGYSLAVVDNYFRINTDSKYRKADMETVKFDAQIESQGWTKERQNSSIPILLMGLTDQLTIDIDGHAKYVGLAIPIRNFYKVYGVSQNIYDENGKLKTAYASSVQKEIHRMYGKGANDYIEKLMADLQMPHITSDFFGRLLAKVRSHYAGAVLTLNAGVAIKQAASYPTAAAEIGWTPLMKAMMNSSLIKGNRLNMDIVYRYSPLMRLRTEGMFTQETGEMKEQGRSIPKALNWIQGMDVATVKKLWKASEYYVRANYKDLKVGSEEYYQKVGEVHTKVIEKTQPNYSTLHRPQLLRTSNELVKTLNMFKTQPFQNLNILMESVGAVKALQRAVKVNPTAENKAELQRARRRMGWAITSQAVSALVFAMMQFAWDLFRKKDDQYRDEEGEIRFETAAKKLAINMGSSISGMIPFGSVIFEAMQVATDKIAKEINPDAEPIFDAVFYGLDAGTATDSINDSLKGIINFLANSVSLVGDLSKAAKDPDYPIDWESYGRDAVNDLIEVLMFAGIPAENTQKMVAAIAEWTLDKGAGMGRNQAKYWLERIQKGITSSNKKSLVANLATVKDPQQYEQLYNTMINEPGFGTSSQTSQEYIDKTLADIEKNRYSSQYGSTAGAYENLLELSRTDQDAFEAEYNAMLENGFSEANIKNGVEKQMKEEAGVTSVKDLDERFEAPGSIQGKFENLYANSDAKMYERGRTGVESGIITYDDYISFLYKLDEADQANTEGTVGSFTKDEQIEAIKAMGWTDSQARKYWDYLPKGDTKNPYK